VEWEHAIAPGTSILPVEAMTNNDSDRLNAVDYARIMPSTTEQLSFTAHEYVPVETPDSIVRSH
jgi:hypothetical protein